MPQVSEKVFPNKNVMKTSGTSKFSPNDFSELLSWNSAFELFELELTPIHSLRRELNRSFKRYWVHLFTHGINI